MIMTLQVPGRLSQVQAVDMQSLDQHYSQVILKASLDAQ
jgi:hypothetical protein